LIPLPFTKHVTYINEYLNEYSNFKCTKKFIWLKKRNLVESQLNLLFGYGPINLSINIKNFEKFVYINTKI